MPIYVFEHPTTGETREEVQRMNEPHVYIDGDKIEWKRVYTSSQLSTDIKINPWSSKAFADATRDKNMSVGDLWDMSADLSERRESKVGGEDPILKKYNAKEKKKRKGKDLGSSNSRDVK
tara:strand:+ start:82 stop:441 length:360 start_codon:yes stop_codon:yes gene_type:complete